MSRKLLVSLLLALVMSPAFAELNLPEKLPQLEVAGETGQGAIGTLDGAFGLAPGERVEGFRIKDHFGKEVSFEQLQIQGPLLVIFYRGGWCPYCNRQIRSVTKAWPEFKQRGVLPVLISADKPDGAAIAQRSYEIPFPVLSDPKLSAHEAFKVTMQVPAELIPKYREYGIDLEAWSGESHHKIAVSSVFLIDEDGIVRWSHSSQDYKKRPSVEQLLKVVDDYESQI